MRIPAVAAVFLSAALRPGAAVAGPARTDAVPVGVFPSAIPTTPHHH